MSRVDQGGLESIIVFSTKHSLLWTRHVPCILHSEFSNDAVMYAADESYPSMGNSNISG